MDSKSISRKGVGVRVPSLVPSCEAAPARDSRSAAGTLAQASTELARLVLPLCRTRAQRLERACVGWTEALRQGLDVRTRRTEQLRARTRDLGLTLGLLGAAREADLLRARREPESLRTLVAWTARALRERFGVALAPAAAELPAGQAEAALGWGAPVAVAWTLARLARHAPPGTDLAWWLSETAQVRSLWIPAPPASRRVLRDLEDGARAFVARHGALHFARGERELCWSWSRIPSEGV